MDIQNEMRKTFSLKGEVQKKARSQMFKEGGLCFNIVTQVQTLVASHGKKYMATDYLTIADAMLFTWLNTMRSGFIWDVDLNFLTNFPELEKRIETIAMHPSVEAYYTTKKGNPLYTCFLPKTAD
jgi:glutathione S-transferase